IGTYCVIRSDSSSSATVQCCDGIWIGPPPMASHRANAIVVLPVPLGPVKRKAALRGLPAKLAMMRLGLSRPTKSPMARGRYFSESGCGKAKEGVLIAHPRLAGY